MMWVQFSFTLASLEATDALGLALGGLLMPGEHLALTGAMGAGKTTLTRSLAQGFGVVNVQEVASPTYAYAHIYGARGRTLHHLDFYRLHNAETAQSLGLDEMLADKQASAVVEWADLCVELLSPGALWLKLERTPETNERTGVLRAPADRALALAQGLPSWVGPAEPMAARS